MILLFHSLQSIAQYKISRLGILDVGFRQFLASNHTLFGRGVRGTDPLWEDWSLGLFPLSWPRPMYECTQATHCLVHTASVVHF